MLRHAWLHQKSEMQHIALHCRLVRMKLAERQLTTLLVPHEGTGFGSKPFCDLRILLFFHQTVFDMEHNRPKILELVQSLAQRV